MSIKRLRIYTGKQFSGVANTIDIPSTLPYTISTAILQAQAGQSFVHPAIHTGRRAFQIDSLLNELTNGIAIHIAATASANLVSQIQAEEQFLNKVMSSRIKIFYYIIETDGTRTRNFRRDRAVL